MSTAELIDEYHNERLEVSQQLMEPGALVASNVSYCGVLTVRPYFNNDNLFVDILRAKDVIPLDSNGTTWFDYQVKDPASKPIRLSCYTDVIVILMRHRL